MIRYLLLTAVLLLALASQSSAQLFGGVVYDPTNYANAVLRYGQLQQQLTQLITTYQQIRTQYLLLRAQAEKLPFSLEARYRALRTPWRLFAAPSTYGTTLPWIAAVNSGLQTGQAYLQATQRLLDYAGALGSLPAAEAARIRARYDRAQLTDSAITHGLTALGQARRQDASLETALQRLEADSFGEAPSFHTQIAVLNKINATAVTAARMTQDTNQLLVSLLEPQLLDATDRREATVQGINAHIAFLREARPLLARTTADTTTALTTFRIP